MTKGTFTDLENSTFNQMPNLPSAYGCDRGQVVPGSESVDCSDFLKVKIPTQDVIITKHQKNFRNDLLDKKDNSA